MSVYLYIIFTMPIKRSRYQSKLICFFSKLSNSNYIVIQYVALSAYEQGCISQSVQEDFCIVIVYLDS